MSTDIDVTCVVLAYRQEGIVAEAIASIFAQEFDGRMEILLSDDCSPDGTFDVMQRMAAEYDGPHQITLNRNAENLGAIFHVNRVFELARGDLIVVNSGDDISTPNRAVRLYECFTADEVRPLMIHSAMDIIRLDGTPTGQRFDVNDRIAKMGPHQAAIAAVGCYGASCAWNKEMFEIYGPMTEAGSYGDLVSTYRAKLLGRLAHVDEPLVLYREGGVSDVAQLSAEQREAYKIKRQEIQLSVLRQRLLDTRTAAAGRRQLIKRLKSRIAEVNRLVITSKAQA